MAAYQAELGVVRAQVALDAKANQSVAAPPVVEQLDLSGVVISGEVLLSQKHDTRMRSSVVREHRSR
jgi:hypothetical protein